MLRSSILALSPLGTEHTRVKSWDDDAVFSTGMCGMTKHVSMRGAAPVGHLSDLDPLEASAVLYLRLWYDGPCAQQQVRNDFSRALGIEPGREALSALEELCSLCSHHGRRPFLRQKVMSRCIGADEACFANLVACATDGAREDALLIATLLVRPDISPQLAAAAQAFGLALKRIALRADRNAKLWAASKRPQTLH